MAARTSGVGRGTRGRYVFGVILATLVLSVTGACSLIEDPTPTNIFFRMSGAAGTEVQLVLSTQFVAGVDESGVTRVELFRSDTVLTVLPVDTTVSVAVDQRFFTEVLPIHPDTLEVQVEVDVDTRNLYDRRGLVWREEPFRFVYLFNQRVTQDVDVVL